MKTKAQYFESGAADAEWIVNQYAQVRHAEMSQSTSWQARAYMAGFNSYKAAAAAPVAPVETVTVSPVDLVVGDVVIEHGATLQVERIQNYESGGSAVAACVSRLVSATSGVIPMAWMRTRESMRDGGMRDAMTLPEGLYFNVQGNHLARVRKIVAAA